MALVHYGTESLVRRFVQAVLLGRLDCCLFSAHNSLYQIGMARSPNREMKFFCELDEVFGVYEPRMSHKQNPTVPTPRVEVEN